MKLMQNYLCCIVFALNICGSLSVSAEEITPEERAFFETKIRPVLVEHCYQCHAEDSDELGGKLLLDSRSGMLKGGESGPSVVAGKSDESLIIQALRYESFEMPPEKPLPEAVINDFVQWVNRGAADPREGKVINEVKEPLDPEDLWSFYPRQEPEIPVVQLSDWPRDELDAYTLARMEANGLQPTRDATPQTIIRRLYFDLTGLAPTTEQVSHFEEDFKLSGTQSIERLVDELLNSPQFGERWGRHWLDVARYGESNGNDGLGRNASFPHAWRYRDYVIDAFNSDMPYDEFITEQIAGDLLTSKSAEERNRRLVATGFLAIGLKPAKAMNKNFDMDIVDDQINAVSTAVMGLSVACARCHDHKHDPIPTADYYALAGIFSSTESLYGVAANEKLTAPPTELHQLVKEWNPDGSNAEASRDKLTLPEQYQTTLQNLKPDLHESLSREPEQITAGKDVSYSEEDFAQVKNSNITGAFPEATKNYSVSLWFKNETQNGARPITAYLFSRAKLGDKSLPGDHLGIGGNYDKSRTGKLFVFNGNQQKKSLVGSTVIKEKTWNHVVLVREENSLRVHLNGVAEPEIQGELPATFGETLDFCVANRSDKFAPLVGNLADLAIFTKALSVEEVVGLHRASGQPLGSRPHIGLAMGVRDKKKIGDCKIHINGDIGKLGPSISRDILSAYRQVSFAPESKFLRSIKPSKNQSGRLELAAWLTHPEHPQTARVLVNRVWLHLFGQALVSTPDDFGIYGARPTHPELLDHLANRLVQDDWSIKRLIRSIVLSRTYLLSSSADQQYVKFDPENKFYARHRRRRLDAESLRDRILQSSGTLDLTRPVGSNIDSHDVLINRLEDKSIVLHKPSPHRSLYLCLLRNSPPPDLAAFDLPDGVGVAGKRNVTTLPTQSLFLFNNPFVLAESESLAKDILAKNDWDSSEQIREIFRRVLVREPSETELEQSSRYLDQLADEFSGEASQATLNRWTSLCQALFATNEFRYID